MPRLLWSSDPEEEPSTSTRDRDLIPTDEHLTDDTLDDLWTWLFNASTSRDGVDPQLVFVKIINSVKIYISYMSYY